MAKTLITVAGTKFYYGFGVFEPGMKVRLCHCPDCGGVHIRLATQPEISDYMNEHPDRSTEKAG